MPVLQANSNNHLAAKVFVCRDFQQTPQGIAVGKELAGRKSPGDTQHA